MDSGGFWFAFLLVGLAILVVAFLILMGLGKLVSRGISQARKRAKDRKRSRIPD